MTEPKKSFVDKTRCFFGVDLNYTQDEVEAWNERRIKFCTNKFGNLNYDKMKSITDRSLSLINGDRLQPMAPRTPCIPSTSMNVNVFNYGRQISSISSQGWLPRSMVSPQISTGLEHSVKKKHAFKAIASVVSESIKRHRESEMKIKEYDEASHKDLDIPDGAHAETAETKFDTVDGEIDTIETQVVQPLKSSMAPRFQRQQSRLSRSLKWTQSRMDKAKVRIKQYNVKRRFTESLVGKVLCCADPTSINKRDQISFHSMLNSNSNYRPYFTYWVSFVQIVIFICSVSIYGWAPISMTTISQYGDVPMPTGSIQRACRHDYANPFIGPRKSDLIRMGARYSPCMRQDPNIEKHILQQQRDLESKSGCCIRNDGGGCYQATTGCSTTLSTLKRHKPNGDPIVCGLDPNWCINPKSQAPFEWSKRVEQWPICQRQNESNYHTQIPSVNGRPNEQYQHMKCELTGHPCCIGSKGECVITTRQHCDFLRGYFHYEANLCSQVKCLTETCGMLPFFSQPTNTGKPMYHSASKPDQFYRFVTALFVLPSIGSLVLTIVLQLSIQRDLEKMGGWHRIMIVYMLSGVMGNLCSGIFLPYQVQCGPSGSLFGIFAMTFTEFLQSWPLIEQPWPVFIRFTGLKVFLLALGFLPFFDNYAQVSGFISGTLLSFFLLPFRGTPPDKWLAKLQRIHNDPKVALDKFQKQIITKRLVVMSVTASLWIGLFAILIVFFYFYPVTNCPICEYMNCIPLAPNFCDNMNVNITSRTPCVLQH